MGLKDVRPGIRNEEGIGKVLGILKQSFGERFQTGQAFRDQHAHTTSYLPAQLPDGVIFVESADDVKSVVRVCAAHRVPMIPFGTGSSLEGHINAPNGGISIDFFAHEQGSRD
jgi:D-lactate dehydrogenase (cytochrome)